MTAYFDNNIYIYIEEGKTSIDKIQENIGAKFDAIFYSNAHVQETLERRAETEELRKERIESRLQIIQDTTKNNYLIEGLDDILIKRIESPFSVLKTITEVPNLQAEMKSLVNKVDEDQRKKARSSLSLPIHINDFAPAIIVSEINKKLGQDLSFNKLIDLAIEQSKSVNNNYNNYTVGFELLDLFGFHKDKFTEKSNYARVWDGIHTYYASFCDYFITHDKNTRQKASVIYHINKVQTKIPVLTDL